MLSHPIRRYKSHFAWALDSEQLFRHGHIGRKLMHSFDTVRATISSLSGR